MEIIKGQIIRKSLNLSFFEKELDETFIRKNAQKQDSSAGEKEK